MTTTDAQTTPPVKKKRKPRQLVNICGAKKKQGPGVCTQAAGWGTNHPGSGKCKLHGGKSTGAKDKAKLAEAMKGNTNSLKHGGRASAWYDVLSDKEQEIYDEEEVDVLEQIKAEIKLLSIRERRMLERIKEVADQGGLILVEKSIGWDSEEGQDYVWRNGRRVYLKELTMKKGYKEKDALSIIMAVEAELTKVQDKKAKLLDLKHRIEMDVGPGDDDTTESLKDYEKALNATAGDVWNDGEED